MICYWCCHLYLSVSSSPYALLFTVGEHIASVCQPKVISELLSSRVIFRHRSTLNTFLALINTLYYSVRARQDVVQRILTTQIGWVYAKVIRWQSNNIFIYRWSNSTYIYYSLDSVLILSSETNKSFYLGQQCRY